MSTGITKTKVNCLWFGLKKRGENARIGCIKMNEESEEAILKLFDYDSAFITWFNRITDLVFISILWVIFCIPVVTAGASTAALYYTIQKCIKNERGTAGSVFLEGFRQNFKQSFLVTIFLLIFVCIIAADISMAQNISTALIWFFKLLIVLVCVYAFWIFSYIARFDCDLKTYMKNAALLLFRHLSVSICLALIGFGSALLLWTLKFLILILPSLTVWFLSILTERVFRRYMTEEDKAMEDERNRDYRDEYIGKRREERIRQKNEKN